MQSLPESDSSVSAKEDRQNKKVNAHLLICYHPSEIFSKSGLWEVLWPENCEFELLTGCVFKFLRLLEATLSDHHCSHFLEDVFV